jgi:hypothetical protein
MDLKDAKELLDGLSGQSNISMTSQTGLPRASMLS